MSTQALRISTFDVFMPLLMLGGWLASSIYLAHALRAIRTI